MGERANISIELVPPIRRARIDDAASLAELVNYAGEGLPLYLWTKMASRQEAPWAIGRARASREAGGFSYRNAFIIEADGTAAGALIGYEIPDQVEPIPADTPAIFRPLQELENLAPGSWYVNVLAVTPQMRNCGLGARLLGLADDLGRAAKKRVMSVIVSDANLGARRLYRRSGYSEVAERPIEKENWVHEGKNWILLTKAI